MAEWIRDIANCLLVAMGFFMAMKEDWVKQYRKLIFYALSFLLLCFFIAGRVADTASENRLAASQDKLTVAQTGLNDSNKQIVSLLTENLSLTTKNFTLQTELVAKAELEKQEQGSRLASIQARDLKRRNEFMSPLMEFIIRGKALMISARSDPAQEYVPRFRQSAIDWGNNVGGFLATMCSGKVARDFLAPIADPKNIEFPTDNLYDSPTILNYYKIRLEYLETVARDHARLCEKF